MKNENSDFLSELMDIAMRLDRFDKMYRLRSDKKPVIELFFTEISDLAMIERRIITEMSMQQRIHYAELEQVPGHSEFSDCRDYQIGPATLRLRCEKVLDTTNGPRLGVRDILFTHRTH